MKCFLCSGYIPITEWVHTGSTFNWDLFHNTDRSPLTFAATSSHIMIDGNPPQRGTRYAHAKCIRKQLVMECLVEEPWMEFFENME